MKPLLSFDVKETDEIQFESYSRIEHVITGYWLHALRGTVAVGFSSCVKPDFHYPSSQPEFTGRVDGP